MKKIHIKKLIRKIDLQGHFSIESTPYCRLLLFLPEKVFRKKSRQGRQRVNSSPPQCWRVLGSDQQSRLRSDPGRQTLVAGGPAPHGHQPLFFFRNLTYSYSHPLGLKLFLALNNGPSIQSNNSLG